MTTLNIEMVSDFICPWCHIGEERLFAAARELGGVELRMTWKPFELNPTMPTDGLNRREYRSRKFGSWEHSQKLDEHVTEAGAQLGLSFNYDRVHVTPNTRLAHRLSWFAARVDKQHFVVPAIFTAYFERGQDIGKIDVLVALAVAAGLDGAEVRTFLEGAAGTEEILEMERTARTDGVNSVPLFKVNGRTLKGAVRTEDLIEALHEAACAIPAPLAEGIQAP